MPTKKKQKFIFLNPEDIIEFYDLKYYANSIWYNKDGVWGTLDTISKEGYKTAYFMALINDVYEAKYNEIPKDERDEYKIPAPKMQIDTGTIIGIVINTRTIKDIFKGIVFKNGYVKTDGKGFTKSEKPPFTTVQIAHDYNPDIKPTKAFLKWFKAITDGKRDIQRKYLTMWSYALSSETLGILMYAYGPGGIGKSEIVEKISGYAGRENAKKVKSTSIFGKGAQVAGRFALRGISNKSAVYMDEFIDKLNPDAGNTLKGLMNTNGYIEFEDKRSNDTETPNTHSWYASSNYYPKFLDMDPWVEERIVIAEFKKVKLNPKDLDEFMSGSYVYSIIPLLVKAYTTSSNYKTTRNKFLKIEEYQAAWELSDALKTDEEIWLTDINSGLNDSTMSKLLEKYMEETNKRSNSTKMGTALKNSGFQRNDNKRPRTYTFVGDIPKKYSNLIN